MKFLLGMGTAWNAVRHDARPVATLKQVNITPSARDSTNVVTTNLIRHFER